MPHRRWNTTPESLTRIYHTPVCTRLNRGASCTALKRLGLVLRHTLRMKYWGVSVMCYLIYRHLESCGSFECSVGMRLGEGEG